MAEEKRSINIAYKADLKDLINKLKQMPNVTEAEARKMVSALDRQLKQAEKAAKKSADASAKAAKNAAAAARRGAKEFEDMADAARRAEERLERVGEASGDIDRGFSSVGLALRGVNPQLAEAADGIADLFAVTEGLTLSFAALNPLVVAGGIAIGALTLGYVAHQAELEKVKETTLALRDAQKALIESQNEQENNLIDAAGKLREQRLEYQLLTGQISEYEFELQKAGEAANESFRGNIEAVQSSISESELLLATIETLKDSYIAAGKSNVVLSEGERERLRTLQLQTQNVKNNLDLTQEGLAQAAELGKLEKALQADIANQVKQREAIEAMQAEAVETAQEMVTLEKELADATEAAAAAKEKGVKPAKKSVDLVQQELDAMEALIEAENRYFDRQINANKKLEDFQIEAFMSEEQREALAFDRRIEEIEKLGVITEQEELAADIIKQMMHNKDLERMDELKKKEEELQAKRREGLRENLDGALELGGALAELTEMRIKGNEIDVQAMKDKQEEIAAMSDIERAAYEKEQKNLRGLFNFRKGMALAEIAMGTAEAVVAAQKLISPFNAIQSALAVATGVAQAGVVMSQQMPSFHMGGMAPDEANARVLRGEAILDRATVRRMGGEQGVRNLQQGGSPSVQTVVIQPFKHFGRFTRDLGIQQTRQIGITGY
tara:strand:+ start:4659 stop:6671 length:2013 start_codon:yes stop_codon:yes gene_type:complete